MSCQLSVQTFLDNGGRILNPSDAEFPAHLHDRTGRPTLHAFGNLRTLSEPGIGLCGFRSASDEGLQIAQRVGAHAVMCELPLVSGYAQGVDTAGHVAAIAGGGGTTAVLAEGVAKFRLRPEYSELIDPLEQLTIVSEFPLDARWTVYRAMQRNKLICGLSRLVVAIEPGEQGGTLNAAQETLRQAKPLILVWPESGEPPAHVQRLIKRGAQLVRSESETIAALDAALDESLQTAPALEPSMFSD